MKEEKIEACTGCGDGEPDEAVPERRPVAKIQIRGARHRMLSGLHDLHSGV